MKKIIEKIVSVIDFLYGYGLLISLAVGGLSFLAYFAALAIGGYGAAVVCEFVYKEVYPVMTMCTACLILLGLVRMYLKGEVALSRKK